LAGHGGREWLYPGTPPDDVATEMLRAGPSIVAVTRGAAGAIVHWRSARVSLPGIPTHVVDTVGAGDAFMAAFLWDLGRRGLINRQVLAGAGEADLAGAGALACQAAAIVCGRAGAEPPLPPNWQRRRVDDSRGATKSPRPPLGPCLAAQSKATACEAQRDQPW
jgi:fructokinase